MSGQYQLSYVHPQRVYDHHHHAATDTYREPPAPAAAASSAHATASVTAEARRWKEEHG